jgi:hypothetical protein
LSDFVLELAESKHTFQSYTVKEYEGLQKRVAEELRKQNRSIAVEIGLEQMDRAKFFKENDPRSISVGEVEQYVSDDRKARSILSQALIQKGATSEDADKVISGMTVVDRVVIAKHVVGLIDLNPLPEEDRKASDLMKTLIRSKCPGLDVEALTVGEFYRVVAQLVPPEDESIDPKTWFEKNSTAGSIKQMKIA